jgi:hypothetical protein
MLIAWHIYEIIFHPHRSGTKRDINMSLLWSFEYFMLVELLTYRFSEAKYRFKSLFLIKLAAVQASGVALVKL